MGNIVLKEPLVCFDVDDTLVSWECYGQVKSGMLEFVDPEDGQSLWLETIPENIEAMKAHKLRGHTVVVWSAGGAMWAKEVTHKLGLSKYVDAYMSKPNWYYDDLPSSEFLPETNRRHFVLKGRSSGKT